MLPKQCYLLNCMNNIPVHDDKAILKKFFVCCHPTHDFEVGSVGRHFFFFFFFNFENWVGRYLFFFFFFFFSGINHRLIVYMIIALYK